jgi:twitching motility protein PilU
MGIRELLEAMVESDASDVYITTGLPPMYRIQGNTQDLNGRFETFDSTTVEQLCFSVMSQEQKKEFDGTYEMNLALSYPSLGRFRVNIFRQKGSLGMVIRQIKLEIMTVDQLELPSILKDLVMTKRGLILVVGATGSGKSTTLAAMIDERNTRASGHIITIEDPVEFVHLHKKCVVTQREVGMDTHSFQSALKNTLRQAPDVILIGEIRDTETMEAAITFAETGHLVFGTLHSNNANQAIERILNFFPEERHPQIHLQLSLNLKAIISQRLIKTLEGGRTAAIEILLDTPRIKDLIKKGEVDIIKEAMAQGEQEGCQTFDKALFDLYMTERIDFDQALANADSANNLRLQIQNEERKSGKTEQDKTAFRIKRDVLH